MTPVLLLLLANKLPGTVCSVYRLIIVFKNSEHTFIFYVSTRNYVPNHFLKAIFRIVYGVEMILGCPIHTSLYRSRLVQIV